MSTKTVPPLVATLGVVGAVLIAFQHALATPRPSQRSPRVQMHQSGSTHLTIRTQEGLERLVIHDSDRVDGNDGDRHYRGHARPRGGEASARPVAFSATGDERLVFFSSRRTGRPVAVAFTLESSSAQAKRVRVYRSPQSALACGSDVHEEETPNTARASNHRTSRRQRAVTQQAMMSPFNPPRVIEVATEADHDFYRIHGRETNAFIRTVLNATDVLYTSSLGIRLKVVSQRVKSKGSPSTQPINAEKLLTEFTNATAGQTSPDLKHLFTGRQLEGMTIGIAYIGTTCAADGRYAVGLSRSVSPALHPYLAAHEIAHNLSAVHDSEPLSVMNPAITSQNNRFTEKAVNSIVGFVAGSGSCLEPEGVGTAALTIDSSDPTQFNARVTFVGAPKQRCTVSLLGSTKGAHFTKVATRKVATSQSGSLSVPFSAPMPSFSTSQSFSFYSQVSCTEGRRSTGTIPLTVGTIGASGASTGKSWLSRLRRALSQ